MSKRKRNAIGTQFVAHRVEMRWSPAWNALPDNARRILDRLEREHMQHGSAMNGALPCTFDDFEAVGIRRQSITLAIRQCVALGFLEVMKEGRLSVSRFRFAAEYRLTYLTGCGKSTPVTDEWSRIKTDEEAAERLAGLAEVKSAVHVRRAVRAKLAASEAA